MSRNRTRRATGPVGGGGGAGAFDVSRRLTRAALAVDLAKTVIDQSVEELKVPGAVQRDVELYTRGMNRADLLAVIAHLAACSRAFANAVPVGERDQIMACLEENPYVALARALTAQEG